jgi:hypothetical protein
LASLIDAFSPDNAWRIWCLGNFLGQTSKSSPRLQMVCPCRQCIHQAGLFMTLRMWLFRIWTKLWNTWTTSFSLRRSVPCQDTEEPTIVVIFGHIYTEMCLDFPRHIKIGSFQRKNNSVSTRSVPTNVIVFHRAFFGTTFQWDYSDYSIYSLYDRSTLKLWFGGCEDCKPTRRWQ